MRLSRCAAQPPLFTSRGTKTQFPKNTVPENRAEPLSSNARPRKKSTPPPPKRGSTSPADNWQQAELPGLRTTTNPCCNKRRLRRKAQGLQWGVQDSNLRRLSHQIYSLTPLTARETPLANPISRAFPTDLAAASAAFPSPPPVVHPWSQRRDLNPQPADYKSAALPIELRWRNGLD